MTDAPFTPAHLREAANKLHWDGNDALHFTETAAMLHDAANQLDAALAEIARCREALVQAVIVIRTWHGMGMPEVSEAEAWRLYQSSPEMQDITRALASQRAGR